MNIRWTAQSATALFFFLLGMWEPALGNSQILQLLLRGSGMDAQLEPPILVTCGEPKKCAEDSEKGGFPREFQLGALIASSEMSGKSKGTIVRRLEYCVPEPQLKSLRRLTVRPTGSSSSWELSSREFWSGLKELVGNIEVAEKSLAFSRATIRLVDLALNEMAAPNRTFSNDASQFCLLSHPHWKTFDSVVATTTGRIELEFSDLVLKANQDSLVGIGFQLDHTARERGQDPNKARYISKSFFVFGYSSAPLF